MPEPTMILHVTLQFDKSTWDLWREGQRGTMEEAIQTALMGLYGVKGVQKVSAEVDDAVQA